MVYAPNANWTAAAADQLQSPSYYIAIDGLTTKHYSTHEVLSAGTTKVVCMAPPRGISSTLDIIDGKATVGTVTVTVADVDGELTDLICDDAPGAPLSELTNVTVTVWGGYRSLAESDFAPIFTGLLRSIKMTSDATGYELTLMDSSFLLDKEIMTDADTDDVVTVQGNIVNVFYSILADSFLTSGDFPLDFVSVDDVDTMAPEGIGIDTDLINTDQLIAMRDSLAWPITVNIEIDAPVNARQLLETELFRFFGCFLAIQGDGTIGLRFFTAPGVADATPATLTTDDIVSMSWSRDFSDHINFWIVSVTGAAGEQSQSPSPVGSTGETVTMVATSTWADEAFYGVIWAHDLRLRGQQLFSKTPATIGARVPLTKRAVEIGDVISVTHPDMPDLSTGTRGVTSRPMVVIGRSVDFANGLVDLDLFDSSFYRTGVVAPSGTSDYDSATTVEKEQYAYFGGSGTAGDNAMSDATQGWRMI